MNEIQISYIPSNGDVQGGAGDGDSQYDMRFLNISSISEGPSANFGKIESRKPCTPRTTP